MLPINSKSDLRYNFQVVHEIVRITVELFAPGAMISPRLANWYMDWDHIHSKRIVYPVQPANLLLDMQEDGSVARMDFAHVRFTPIGISFTGIIDGVMDHLLTTTRLDYLLGHELPRIVQKAVVKSKPYVNNRTQFTWLEIFEVDEENTSIKYFSDLNLEELVEVIKKTAE